MPDDFKELAQRCYLLNKELKEKQKQLDDFKKSVIEKMREKNMKKIESKDFSIVYTKWKNDYLSSLEPEFKNISAEKLNELISQGIVNISYNLNSTEFQKLKEIGKTTEIDSFVKERKNKDYIVIKSKD